MFGFDKALENYSTLHIPTNTATRIIYKPGSPLMTNYLLVLQLYVKSSWWSVAAALHQCAANAFELNGISHMALVKIC